MELEERLFMCVVLEDLLRDTKANIINDFIEIENKKLGSLSHLNRKNRKETEKYIKSKVDDYKKMLVRSQKYNKEMIDLYKKETNGNCDEEFMEKVNIFYLDFTTLLFHKCKETGNYEPAMLRQSEKGNLFVNNKRFELLTNKNV